MWSQDLLKVKFDFKNHLRYLHLSGVTGGESWGRGDGTENALDATG